MATWPGGQIAIGDPRSWTMKDPWIRLVSVEDSCPTLISGRGGKWLIDPGSARVWAYTLRPFLAWHGIRSLDGAIVTAAVSDRMGGAVELVDAMPVRGWAETGTSNRSPAMKTWLADMERREEGKQFWREGEERNWGTDWKVRVLWPPGEGGRGRSEEYGMVLWLEHGPSRLLWAGSISGEVEREIVRQHGPALRAAVLVQGPAQAGEANLTPEWLEAVQPQTVIRWSRALEEDTSLSVDFAERAWMEGVELLKLEETGCLTLTPEEGGKWKMERWKQRDEDEDED